MIDDDAFSNYLVRSIFMSCFRKVSAYCIKVVNQVLDTVDWRYCICCVWIEHRRVVQDTAISAVCAELFQSNFEKVIFTLNWQLLLVSSTDCYELRSPFLPSKSFLQRNRYQKELSYIRFSESNNAQAKHASDAHPSLSHNTLSPIISNPLPNPDSQEPTSEPLRHPFL